MASRISGTLGEKYAAAVSGKRGKWMTLIVWIAAVVLFSSIWPSVNQEENNSAANLAESTPSSRAAKIMDQEFPESSGVPALLVWHRDGGLQQEDLAQFMTLAQSLEQDPLPYQSEIPPYYAMPANVLLAQASEDGSTLVTPIFFEAGRDAEQLKEGVEALEARSADVFGTNPFAADKDSSGQLSARVTGPVGISIDATGLFKSADFSLMIGTVLLVLIILLVIYRSPILALIPLVAVGFAFGVISPLLGVMADRGWITVDSQAISIMTVLLFGAGTDYCLFLISRFRQLLTQETNKGRALVQAFVNSSGAIAMSGLTVVISLIVLLLAKYGAYYRFAIPFSLSILIMGIASLTLVPALLAILGRASFYPFIPRTDEMLKERAAKLGKPFRAAKPERNWLGNAVVRKPWLIAISTLLVLGALATFSTQLKFSYDILSSFPEEMPSREGFALIEERFGPGELAPTSVIADSEGQAIDLKSALADLPFVASVSDPKYGESNPDIQSLDVRFAMNPYSMEAMSHIPNLQAAAEDALKAAGIADAEAKVWVGGATAVQHDTKVVGDRDASIIIPVVIALISILLLLYLRSVVATVYLIGTVVLSYFSALGLGWLILHEVMGVQAIQGAIPLYAFVFLVALGEDYNIFMISRIWQKSRTMPLKEAIRDGVGETGSVITSAGIILAGTFAVLATLPLQVLVQFGVITALGLLLDTFVVRPLLVPAITVLLGKRAFWPARSGEAEIGRETSASHS